MIKDLIIAAIALLANGYKTIAITCKQWGDTGKGKFVDLFAQYWATIIVRATGGNNAGHTLWHKGKKFVFHILPSGILYDKEGKINVIAHGTVIYPKILMDELKILEKNGFSYDNLKIALNAKLILPWHILLDRAKESRAGKDKVGSTGNGITPAYVDHIGRNGLIVNDLLNPSLLKAKLERNWKQTYKMLVDYDQDLIRNIMVMEILENGLFYDDESIFNIDAVTAMYIHYGILLKSLICDTDTFIKEKVGKENILLEGAQGDLLSIESGAAPHVTSSPCELNGLATGAGIHQGQVDLSLGIIKGFIMTRVGKGPFPTEYGGSYSEEWCNSGEHTKKTELKISDPGVNYPEGFLKGIALRRRADEYGATTGRPRRVGRLDLPLLRAALRNGSRDIILTKLDVLDEMKEIEICTHYIYTGSNYQYGERLLQNGDTIQEAIMHTTVLENSEPEYVYFPGWLRPLKDCSSYEELPKELKDILEFIITSTGIRPKIISIGPKPEETIFCPEINRLRL